MEVVILNWNQVVTLNWNQVVTLNWNWVVNITGICSNDLITSGFKVLFRSENIDEGLSQLSSLTQLPNVCIIDLDFYDKSILMQLQEFRTKYPSIKLIAHSDIDNEKVAKALLNIGFSSYLLVGSDVDNFKKATENN